MIKNVVLKNGKKKDNEEITDKINTTIDNLNKRNSNVSNGSYIINLNDISNEMGSSIELTEKSLLDLNNEHEEKEKEKEEKKRKR